MPQEQPPNSWTHELGHQLAEETPENELLSLHELLSAHAETTQLLLESPYCFPLYLSIARTYQTLGYPDLAAGAAYKALLLSDAIRDDSDEYHEQATEAFEVVLENSSFPDTARVPSAQEKDECNQTVTILESFYLPLTYNALAGNLLRCGCLRSAYSYSKQAAKLYPHDSRFNKIMSDARQKVPQASPDSCELDNPLTWPDQGYVRREQYPWNTFEPDRFSQLGQLNAMMSEVAPRLEVLAVDLPAVSIAATAFSKVETVKQLGIFAKEDIKPGETVLVETSLLAANNKLQDALCDACSADLPGIGTPEFENTVPCDECEVVFCSQECCERAADSYHPALCGMDVETIAKDVPPTEAANSLYSLLLLRALAMAETRQCHPLSLDEVKYIWAEFHNLSLEEAWSKDVESPFRGLPQMLPFSFEYNIRLPFHMLEKMDIDIFRNPQYDVWVFNSLYAKFRGTASARLSGLGGRAIRGPEVSAVHPMWCMANHSCDPNVSWEWGGSIRFWAREERVDWQRDEEVTRRSEAGIRKGDELLNHYCDIELGVKDRREWANGSLGGDCRCARCLWEAREMENGH
ncbi:uncharacterized protein LTR77_003398 [Saxophila tyrrhenica]|uniref:SET domain-containing protein n=1 Tax=Saxophila tyrrhenica TaxID=1690608 RepID=A0AAV9PHI7_9PEZI|nr:hypothetical protein LTR77_003398 [Saxophila tyrrhenica]